MSHEPQLIPDVTLFIQLAIFLASYAVLRVLVFNPFARLLQMRADRTTGLKEKAVLARERADKLHADYETFMKSERKKIAAWMEEERKKVNDEERAIIQQARGEVASQLGALRAQMQVDTEKARRELLPLISEYSSHIATKLLGRRVDANGATSDSVHPTQLESTVPG